MPQVVFVKPFRFSPNGYDVIRYEASEDPVEVSEECARIARSVGVLAAAEERGEDREESVPEQADRRPRRPKKP